ncbi:unnamed protein product [Adineta ricciae]|uniref:G-protein coupled receptors family 1 profile domain-containing protein n=1 Tax=Adineta ricciae TaxID=249248 RepID=A0A815KZN0_ADIRI|nr:unnamed protein product [Adineta ricciae]CAF1399845.1 unnamed protein product [Adineta ricciae]
MSNIAPELVLTSRWLNIIAGIALFAFGLVGNCFNIYIFTRPRFRRAPSVQYLLAGSIANLIQLGQTLLPRILGDGFGIPIIQSSTIHCQIRLTLAAVATLCSISYPCWASFDHAVSTSQYASTRHYYTSKRFVYCAIFGTVFFWFIVYVPSTLHIRATKEVCAGSNYIITCIYSYGISPAAYSILPIALICYLNYRIVRNLQQMKRVNSIGVRNTRLVRQVRRMLIPQLIVLIISGIPFSIQTIYSVGTMAMSKDSVRQAAEGVILNLVRLLFYLNYVCSFYVYIVKSSEIRHECGKMFGKRYPILPQGTVINGNER